MTTKILQKVAKKLQKFIHVIVVKVIYIIQACGNTRAGAKKRRQL